MPQDMTDDVRFGRHNRNTMKTMLDAVSLQATQGADGDQPAITYLSNQDEPITITRRDFAQQAQAYARALQTMGIGARDLVVIAHTQSLESIYAFWGALLVGAIPSMFPTLTEKLDVNIYMRSMAELTRLSNAQAVLTTDDFAPTLREVVTACPVYGSQDLLEQVEIKNSPLLIETPAPDSIAFLQHSSGTTGLQKGVALSHKAVLNHIASYSDSLALGCDDVIVSWLPLYHDMGLIAGFLMPILQGVHLVLMSPFEWVKSPAILLKAIHDYKGTLCWLPNFAYNHCARRIRKRDYESLDISNIRAFINCSEPVRADSHTLFVERFAGIGAREDMLAVSYAMAENVFAVTQTHPQQPARVIHVNGHILREELRVDIVDAEHDNALAQVSCGKPIAGVQVRVLDDSGSDVGQDCVGEIAITSDSLLTGYYKRDDLQPIRDGWYMTGDRGFIHEGEVYVIGRSKDLIINAGKNVYPQDLEAIANSIEGIHAGRVVAFGVPDEREGTELIAIVAEVHTQDPDEQRAIMQSIRATIAQQTTVTVNFVKLVDERWLIKTSSGKIARNANRDKWLTERNLR
jgi:fatty-acyl-CoA synthase